MKLPTNYFHSRTNGFVDILDIHFGKKCNIRLDNTEEIIKDKIKQIISYCLENKVRVVVIAGDVFDNCSIDRKTFMKAYKILKEFKDFGIDLFTIYGNHDEYRYNKDFRKETPLNDMEELGIITVLDYEDTIEIYNEEKDIIYNIQAFPYLNNKQLKNLRIPREDREYKYQFVIGHAFYNNEFLGGESDNITKDDVESMNCDYLILGHDHSYYEPERVFNTDIFRFGSLVRGTSSNNDLQRKVKFMHFYGDGEWKEIELKTNTLKEVLSVKSEVKEQNIDFKELIEDIKMEEDIDNTVDSIMETINKIENKEIKEIIRRNL